jgi:tetraacyldisaccharide 4'-kinase
MLTAKFKKIRKLLLPFSLLFWIGVTIRNWFFEIGILKITKVGVPVISIGNISTGGAGKTPIVEMLVEKLSGDRQIAVVSRGYGRKSKGTVVVSDGKGNLAPVEISGDEPSQLAIKFPNLIVIVDEIRVRGAQKAIEFGAEIILLDDGFQHRYLHRDLNLVVMTVEEILNGDGLLPVGNGRELMSSLKRADVIVITRCKDIQDFERVKETIRWKLKAIVGMQIKLKSLKLISSNETITIGSFAKKKILALSGIGNPKSFENVLAQADMNVAKHIIFVDHHWYTESDIKNITEIKKQLKADFIMTTEKDAARLRERFMIFLKSEQVIVAEIRQEILTGEEKLDEILKQVLQRCILE